MKTTNLTLIATTLLLSIVLGSGIACTGVGVRADKTVDGKAGKKPEH